MSAATDSVVAVAFLAIPTAAAGVVGAAGLAAYGVGYGAYAAAVQLQKEYEAALGEFQARAAVEQAQRVEAGRRRETAAAHASALAAGTHFVASGDPTLEFLEANARRLAERAASLGDAVLAAGCRALVEEIEGRREETAVLLARYFSLSDAVAAAAAAGIARCPNAGDALNAVLRAVRQEIESPLLLRPACAPVRAQLTAQFQKLERLSTREATLVLQGLELLRQRVQREVRRQAEREQERMQNAAAVRELVSQMLARLRAVSRQTLLPEAAAQAEALLRELNSHLARAEGVDSSSLRQLEARVDRLFGECERALQQQAVAEYVSSQVTDVLLSLGYQINHLPPERPSGSAGCVALLDSSIGVQFRVEADGRLRTEAVALTESASGSGEEVEERVCALVDQVLQSLRQRPECRVRERARRRAKSGERLRVLKLAGGARQPLEVAAPKRITRELS